MIAASISKIKASSRHSLGMNKRILFLVGGSVVYGAEIAMLNVIRGLRDRGHVIHCIVSGWNDGNFISRLGRELIPYSILYLGSIYVRKPLWTLDTLWHYPKALAQFRRIQRDFKPDLTYHVSPRTILMLYPLLYHGSTVFHVHDVASSSSANRFQFRALSKKVSRFICASEAVRQSVRSLGVSDEKTMVVWNGVRDFEESACIRDDGSRDIFTVGIVGQVIKRKGHDVLIDALKLVRQSGKNFRCMIVGNGDPTFVSFLKSRISDYDLEPNFEWVSYTPNILAIYRQLDVLAMPTYNEAFGIVAVEAALCGLPVLASRVGGLPEVVQDGITGYLFSPGDKRELANRILLLMDQEGVRESLGRAARAYAHEHFTDRSMCSQIDSVLASLG